MTAKQALFRLGKIVATPGARDALDEARADLRVLLHRHITGDWGLIPLEDQEANNLAVGRGDRILSAYWLNTGVKLWVLTEADRSVTTFLLPEEY